MRTIERTKAFHRDWKKVGSGVHGKRASGLLQAVVALLERISQLGSG
jgi:mRNA-degrading endonuclease YafQ of YafQ-DinJ toxin-antitoxin module